MGLAPRSCAGLFAGGINGYLGVMEASRHSRDAIASGRYSYLLITQDLMTNDTVIATAAYAALPRQSKRNKMLSGGLEVNTGGMSDYYIP